MSTKSWLYKGSEIEDTNISKDSIGFLYKITNTVTGEWYIGRKLLTSSKTKTINGKKKKIRVENDWKDYWSSNELIKEEAKVDPDKFKREILIFVPTMGAMTLGEEYLLHVSGALFDPKCLNRNIRAKIFSSWFTKIPDFWPELKSVINQSSSS